ncbi:hypothetical protein, partial [Evtepia sp.]
IGYGCRSEKGSDVLPKKSAKKKNPFNLNKTCHVIGTKTENKIAIGNKCDSPQNIIEVAIHKPV